MRSDEIENYRVLHRAGWVAWLANLVLISLPAVNFNFIEEELCQNFIDVARVIIGVL